MICSPKPKESSSDGWLTQNVLPFDRRLVDSSNRVLGLSIYPVTSPILETMVGMKIEPMC
jgi:hypothetical protein